MSEFNPESAAKAVKWFKVLLATSISIIGILFIFFMIFGDPFDEVQRVEKELRKLGIDPDESLRDELKKQFPKATSNEINKRIKQIKDEMAKKRYNERIEEMLEQENNKTNEKNNEVKQANTAVPDK
jgi:preprotein translocase subunit SecF